MTGRIRRRVLVARLEELLQACDSIDVEGLQLSSDQEAVTIIYTNGYKRDVCIAADSDIAIIRDVINHI